MIAANVAMAEFLDEHKSPTIRRVVRTPERWDRIVALAAALGERLPAAPDSAALEAFLTKRQAADPDRYPDLSLSVVKLIGPGRVRAARARRARHRTFRPRHARLHARDGAEPPLCRPRHAATPEGGPRRQAVSVLHRRPREDRGALHRAGRRRPEGGAPGSKGSRRRVVRLARRRELRRDRDRSVAEGDLRPRGRRRRWKDGSCAASRDSTSATGRA